MKKTVKKLIQELSYLKGNRHVMGIDHKGNVSYSVTPEVTGNGEFFLVVRVTEMTSYLCTGLSKVVHKTMRITCGR